MPIFHDRYGTTHATRLWDFSLDNEPEKGYYLLVLHPCITLPHSRAMPIPFVPYQKEYREQIKILVALLNGELQSGEGSRPGAPSPYPHIMGHYQGQPVEIYILQHATREGADPLNSEKYLHIRLQCSCSLTLTITPLSWRSKLARLFWWRQLVTGREDLDSRYAIASPERGRTRRLLSHKKVKNLLYQMSPFHTLTLTDGHLLLSYAVTSHHILTARRVAEVLRRMLRFGRLCQNLA
jgi:hypothetical protein